MHPVHQIILNRLAGQTDTHRLAIVASGGAQRWPVVGGMLARAAAHGLKADIIGGTSGGGLAMVYYGAGNVPDDVMVLRHLTHQGYNRQGGARLITYSNVLRHKPILDVEGLVEDAFTLRVPVRWENFAKSTTLTFLVATSGEGKKVLQRLDGQNVETCKMAAKNTGRVPWLAHPVQDKKVLWDGALCEDFPVDSAFELGATHVLALSCRGKNQVFKKSHVAARYIIAPKLRQHQPHLAKLVPEHHLNFNQTIAKYQQDPRVLIMQLPIVNLKTNSTDERLLLQGALDGWHYFGQTLGLPAMPLPLKWQEAMRENSL